MGYQAKNLAAIQRGFDRLRKAEYERCKQGMINLAQAGLLYLVDAHEMYNIQESHHHLNEDNTLAWAVAYNGTIVASGDLEGALGHGDSFDDIPGEARQRAEAAIKGTSGWVAIIFSSMEGWYNEEWERFYLEYSKDSLAADFDRIFTRVDL